MKEKVPPRNRGVQIGYVEHRLFKCVQPLALRRRNHALLHRRMVPIFDLEYSEILGVDPCGIVPSDGPRGITINDLFELELI